MCRPDTAILVFHRTHTKNVKIVNTGSYSCRTLTQSKLAGIIFCRDRKIAAEGGRDEFLIFNAR